MLWDVANPAHTLSIGNLGNIALEYLNIVRYDTLHLVKPSLMIPASRSGLLQKAESYLNYAYLLAKEVSDISNISFITGIRSELSAEKGDYKKAYYDLVSYHDMYDSIYSQEYKNNIASLESKREVAIRDKQIELDNLALSAQRKQQLGLIAGIGLLLTIGLLLLRQSRLRKNTNIELTKLNFELDEANKVKAKFFAILSHDLRSPLANLIDFLHLQKEEPNLITAQSEALHRHNITTAAETLLENMETMLLWSKEQMEHFKPQIKAVEVDMLFGYLSHTFSPTQKIGYSFSNPEKIVLSSDENYLKTIIYNLTANAVAALQNKDDGFITWKAWKEGNTVFLSITDNGIGFPLELISNWNTNSISINERNGFGMHIVKDMAKAIDCKVSLSNTNTGACVTMQM